MKESNRSAQTEVQRKGKRAARKPRPSAQRARGAAAGLDPEARRRLIAEAAYYKAEARGFVPGFEETDWLVAEQEIDARFASGAG